MKNKFKTKISSILFYTLAIANGMCYSSQYKKIGAVMADEINNVNKIVNPKKTDVAFDAWTGNYIYFGHYKQSSNNSGGFNIDPIKWQVLDNNNLAWDDSKNIKDNGFAFNVGDNGSGR